MKNKILYLSFIILTAVTTTLSLYQCRDNTKTTTISITDTLYIREVIRDTIPKLITQTVTHTIRDTVYNIDSIPIPIILPIASSTYSNEVITTNNDTVAYKAYISGYKARMDSISINMRYKHLHTTTTNTRKRSWKDNFFIAPNISFGYGLFNRKSDIYIGIGIGYKLDL